MKSYNERETAFLLRTGIPQLIFVIENSLDESVAYVYRTIYIGDEFNMKKVRIIYDLSFNKYKEFSQQEIRMIRGYYDNLVNMLTRDIQTIYTQDINERLELPFMANILHVKVVE